MRAWLRLVICLALVLCLSPWGARAETPAPSASPSPTPADARATAAEGVSPMRVHVVRLRPGDDLRKALQTFANTHRLRAAFVITCVGSVRQAHLRLANQSEGTRFSGPFEIVSLVGTLSREACHLHASVSRSDGTTVGGHLLEGCPVYTTAEIVIGEAEALRFDRRVDPGTTFPELEVRRRDDP